MGCAIDVGWGTEAMKNLEAVQRIDGWVWPSFFYMAKIEGLSRKSVCNNLF